MERHVYTIPVNEFEEYKRRLKLSSNMLINFWYETPEKTEPTEKHQTTKKKGKLPAQIAGFIKDTEGMQGLSSEGLKEFEENRKIFKETFDI